MFVLTMFVLTEAHSYDDFIIRSARFGVLYFEEMNESLSKCV